MKTKRTVNFLIFIACFITLFAYLYVQSNNILFNLGTASYSALSSSASYNAIEISMVEQYNYEELVKISKNNQGQIELITTDSIKVNKLATCVANNTYEYLTKEINAGVDVPLGAFSGIELISGFGTTVKMKLMAVSSVKCDIVSTFEEAGINQTRHTLMIVVKPTITVITNTKKELYNENVEILVYDNFIIGQVPSVYVNSQIIGEGKQIN